MFYNAGIWTLNEAEDYDEFFKDKAQQHGLDPEEVDSASDDRKKEFYNDVDDEWEAENENFVPIKIDEEDEIDESVNLQEVDVRTEPYEASHGKKPSGRGGWAFGFDARYPSEVDHKDLFWVQGSKQYSEALAIAKQEAKKRGAHTILVMP